MASGTLVAVSRGGTPGNGQLAVAPGGTAVGAVISADGFAYVSLGGLAASTVLSGGDLGVYGGTAVDTTIGRGSIETVGVAFLVSSNEIVAGVATATTIDGGTLDLEGGNATGDILFGGSGGGLLDIGATTMPSAVISGFGPSDGIDLEDVPYTGLGTATFDAATEVLTVTEGGSSYTLELAGIAASATFSLSADGLSGTGVAMVGAGTSSVSSGVVSSGVDVGNGAQVDVLSGGTAIATTVGAGAGAFVLLGGTEIGTMVQSRGLDEVMAGGIASATTVDAYGRDQVYGVATGALVGYGGAQAIFAGGTAVQSVVDGALTVFSGGVTTSAELVDGSEYVSSGGVASGTLVAGSGGIALGDGAIYVGSGGTMTGAVVNLDGYAALSAGGLAIGTILSGGDMAVDGGTAIDTTIGRGSTETVADVYVVSTAQFIAGVASDTTIAGGTLALDGAIAEGGILFGGTAPGFLDISGTVMPAATIGGFGAADEIDLENLAYSPSGTVSLDSATDVLTVTEGGSSVALQLGGSYGGTVFGLGPDAGTGTVVAIAGSGRVTVSSGVTSTGIGLDNGGVLTLLSGGTAISTTVGAGGVALVSGGGSALATVVQSRGLDLVLSGGVASATVVQSSGGEAVYGSAVGTTVDYAASQTVFGGGTAAGTLVSGTEFVASGGVTRGADVSFGFEVVSSGGLALDTLVGVVGSSALGAGEMAVSSGGTAVGSVVGGPGFVTLSAGALAIGTILSGGDLALAGGTAVGTTIGSGGIETVFVTYVFSTGDYLSGLASATTIAGGTLLLEGGSATGGILFSGSTAGLLDISGTAMPTTPISGFSAGDEIDLENLPFGASGTVTLDASTDVLTVVEGGSSAALELAGADTGDTFTLNPDTGSGTVIGLSSSGTVVGTSDVPCFAAGTRISTDRGEIAVEHLVVGDRVLTGEGEAMPIRWIGHRRVDCRRHPEPRRIWPVLIEADAFAAGSPGRVVLLSPDHAVFAEGVFIPIRHLIDGAAIRQLVVPFVTYFHVELDRHAVILAERLPVESYLDTGDRTGFDTAAGPVALHPAFAAERTDTAFLMDALGFAPLRVTGPEVAAVRTRLAARAAKGRRQARG